MNILYFLISGLIGYIAGAVPFGFLYVRARKGINLTEYGSGRTGGTNSLRAAGVGVGVLTGLSDVFKGFAGLWVARWLLNGRLSDDLLPWALIICGVATVIGHNWSIFLKWKGGAGTAPNVGWATAIWWPMFPIGFITMVAMLIGLGIASVASMTMAAIIPISFAVLYFAGVNGYDGTAAYIIGGIATAAVVVWALRPNIKRLLNGTERVVGPRAKRAKTRQNN